MTRLAMTTSTDCLGVAVETDEGEVFSAQFEIERRHAEELTPMIADLLQQSNSNARDLRTLIVDVGPGRFTGLRVGIATALGLGIATSAQYVQLSSLNILAAAEVNDSTSIAAVIDGRRGEVFQQLFSPSGEPVGDAQVAQPKELATATTQHIVVGDGADLYNEIYSDVSGAEVRQRKSPNPEVMLRLAEREEPVASLAPIYLRGPDAVPNVKTRYQDPKFQSGKA